MPGKPNWGLLRKYFNGNLKFIRLLARQRYCGALGPISAQTDFIFIHLRDFQRQFSEYGDNDDDAHAPISARNSRTSFGGSLGIWGGRNGVQRLGTVDWGAVAALWFIALTLPAWCCPCFHSLHSLHRLFKPSLCLSVGLSAIQTEMLVKGGPDQNRPGNYSSPRICWDIP